MPTNTRGSVARDTRLSTVQYIAKTLTFANAGQVLVGTLPAGAVILKAASGAHVHTVFNAGTTNTIDIGTNADGDAFGSSLAGGAVAFVPLDEAADFKLAADTAIYVEYKQTGAAATTGEATIYIAYIPRVE
jgi:hypothetical protein